MGEFTALMVRPRAYHYPQLVAAEFSHTEARRHEGKTTRKLAIDARYDTILCNWLVVPRTNDTPAKSHRILALLNNLLFCLFFSVISVSPCEE